MASNPPLVSLTQPPQLNDQPADGGEERKDSQTASEYVALPSVGKLYCGLALRWTNRYTQIYR